jgi:hypothetical protein
MSLYYYGTPTRSEEWYEVKKKSGEYKLKRRRGFEPSEGVDAEDDASMQSTISIPGPSSRGIDEAMSKDV